VSAVFARPGYQNGVQGIAGSHRGVPDLSLSASLSGGVLVYSSYPVASHPGGAGWGIGGGTSAATPEFAGIVAIADQYAHQRLGLINPALYRLERAHAAGIVDVTKGNNTVTFPVNGQPFTVTGYSAAPGYNLATGLGTVNAARLVPELAAARG
jgi:subtilase family serine protease